MATGIAIHIGLNNVDPERYAGWDGPLTACEADAEDMASIAKAVGFGVTTLLTRAATRSTVAESLRGAAKKLGSGDILLLTYSGHGGQLPDLNQDEPDAQDETWCLYDGEQVDDELYEMLVGFVSGVRIFVLSDSCHSGTVTRMNYRTLQSTGALESLMQPLSETAGTQEIRFRAMPREVAFRTYRTNKNFYDEILKRRITTRPEQIKSSVLLISGCQDNQLSSDGEFNGLFTATLLRVWKDGLFKGDYPRLHRQIVDRMPPTQTPKYFVVGTPNPEFERQKPFSI
jgi:hypothetical protein